MTKTFFIQKVSYTAGVYGNTGEQFQLVLIDENAETPVRAILFDGMFGVESRVMGKLKELGWSSVYVASPEYTKVRRADVKRYKDEPEVMTIIEGLR